MSRHKPHGTARVSCILQWQQPGQQTSSLGCSYGDCLAHCTIWQACTKFALLLIQYPAGICLMGGASPAALLSDGLGCAGRVADSLPHHALHVAQVGVALAERLRVALHAPNVLPRHARGSAMRQCRTSTVTSPTMCSRYLHPPATPCRTRESHTSFLSTHAKLFNSVWLDHGWVSECVIDRGGGMAHFMSRSKTVWMEPPRGVLYGQQRPCRPATAPAPGRPPRTGRTAAAQPPGQALRAAPSLVRPRDALIGHPALPPCWAR